MRTTGTSKRARWIGAAAALLLAAGALTAAIRGTDDAQVRGASGNDDAQVRSAIGNAAAQGVAGAEMAPMAGSSALGAGGGGGDAAAVADVAGGAALSTSGTGQGLDPGGPRIVKRSELRIEVKEGSFRTAFDRVTALASAHGGFVAGSSSRTASDDGDDRRLAAGTLLLRVPAAAFDTVRAALADLGDVKGDTVSGEDVGAQLVDLDARIRSLQVEEDALRTLMGKARTVGETIEVQQHLTRVRQQIEQLQAQRGHLADAAALATVHVELGEPGVAHREPGTPNRFAESFRTAIDGSLAVFGGTVIVLGYVVPLGLLALLAWVLWRLATRRTRLAV